jgi:hypothetical protein
MLRLIPLIFFISCGPYRIFKKDFITPSESPCIDGTILNIHQAGCESFYWGTNRDGVTLKIRCSYAPEMNWWTARSFYAVPHEYGIMNANWQRYCIDKYVKMYAVPMGTKLEIKNAEE